MTAPVIAIDADGHSHFPGGVSRYVIEPFSTLRWEARHDMMPGHRRPARPWPPIALPVGNRKDAKAAARATREFRQVTDTRNYTLFI